MQRRTWAFFHFEVPQGGPLTQGGPARKWKPWPLACGVPVPAARALRPASGQKVTPRVTPGHSSVSNCFVTGTAQRSSVREQCLAGHSEAVFTPAGSLRMHQAAAADSKFASISRLLFIAQPHRVFRTVFRRGSKAGPIGVLLFFFGLLAAVLSAIQKTLAYRVRTCKCCRGYGIVRCSLCAGAGKVGWTAKFSYEDGCPMCMAKRYVDCPDCGGIIKRSLFPSGRNPPPGMEEPSFKRRTA
eukprot:gene11224-18852_t